MSETKEQLEKRSGWKTTRSARKFQTVVDGCSEGPESAKGGHRVCKQVRCQKQRGTPNTQYRR